MSITQWAWRNYMRLKNPTCTINADTLARQVTLEDHVTLEKGSYIGAKKIGRYSFIGLNSYVDKSTESIGRFCSIAMSAKISMKNHPMDWISSHPFTYHKSYGFVHDNFTIPGLTDKKTKIGHDVWIGTNVTILAGVTIGNGAILGANSLVTKDVEPYSIVSGSPAQHIRFRFDPDTVRRINDSAWWNWEDEQLKKNLNLFRDVSAFVSRS
jgi:virginiamycin A acetyltransferase